jgi:hypothetical protein
MIVKTKDKIFFGGITLLAVFAFGYGLSLIPSPLEARNRQYDDQRVSDVQALQYSIEDYARENYKLPDTLDQTSRAYTSSTLSKTDPETKAPYEYAKVNQFQYQLCATFGTNTTNLTKKDRYSDPYNYNYDNPEYTHPKGRHCFTKTVAELEKLQNPWNGDNFQEFLKQMPSNAPSMQKPAYLYRGR